ncbi:unnamed protein product [Orchesella dallaii]|uniref:SSD domain-containing protein n=1 Tax=Orchesella dallaii TaxID=48710 RepID=A0ABP1PHB1_9HEXA
MNNSTTKFSISKVLTLEVDEAMAYGYALSAIAFPITAVFLPFICDYDPAQLVIEFGANLFFPRGPYHSTIVKTLASIFYFEICLHAYFAVVYIFLVALCFTFCIMRSTNELKLQSPVPQQRFHLNTRNSIEFGEQLERYRLLQLLTTLASNTSKDLLAIGVANSALLSASMAYFVFFLYDYMPLVMYTACCFVIFLIFSVNFMFCTLASQPNKDTDEFRERWAKCLVSRIGRMRLRSCAPIGFAVGFSIRITKPGTALTVADAIVNSMATMALMG